MDRMTSSQQHKYETAFDRVSTSINTRMRDFWLAPQGR